MSAIFQSKIVPFSGALVLNSKCLGIIAHRFNRLIYDFYLPNNFRVSTVRLIADQQGYYLIDFGFIPTFPIAYRSTGSIAHVFEWARKDI